MTIPMFFYGRCFEKGKQLEGLNLMDLAPTIASLMGAIFPASGKETIGASAYENHKPGKGMGI